MNILKNQSGFSLMEVMIAGGILITLAAGGAMYNQNMYREEAKRKVRGAEITLHQQLEDYVKNRDLCDVNVAQAFKDIPISGEVVSGTPDYGMLSGKEIEDASGNFVSKEIFRPTDLFEGGKLMLKSVSYEMRGMKPVMEPGSPYNQQGTLRISLKLAKCTNGSRVYTKVDDVLIQTCPENMLIEHTKFVDKILAVKTDASRKITTTPSTRFSVVKNVDVPVTKYNLACGHYQDDESQDKKLCALEVKILIATGKSGTTSCGDEVVAEERTHPIPNTPGFTFDMPKDFLPNSLTLKIVGGGGAGGGGKHKESNSCDTAGGYGGRAGTYLLQQLQDFHAGLKCKIILGAGGLPDGRHPGKPGEKSSFICKFSDGTLTPLFEVAGGTGGATSSGDSGGEAGESSGFGPFTGGSAVSAGSCRGGNSGSKGGGGGGSGHKNKASGKGGDGFAELTYQEVYVKEKTSGVMYKPFDFFKKYSK